MKAPRNSYIPAANRAAAGMVRSQAVTMSAATPHRTAETRVVAPAPITDPEITWVVETGNPYFVATV